MKTTDDDFLNERGDVAELSRYANYYQKKQFTYEQWLLDIPGKEVGWLPRDRTKHMKLLKLTQNQT